jgi:hypothetical protein
MIHGMPAATTKVSVSLPTETLRRAERLLGRAGEGRSALLARVLAEAVDRALDEQYAEGYRRQPVTPEEDAVMEAAAREGFADLRADERAHGRTWRPRAAR